MSTLLMHASHAASIGAAQSFVSSLWEGAALALLVWCGIRLISRSSATTRFAVWMMAFSVLAFLPFAGFLATRQAGTETPVFSAPPTAFHLDSRWALAIAFAWILGSVARAGSLLWNANRLRILWKGSSPVNAGALEPGIKAVLHARGSRGVEIRLSDGASAPCAIGFFRPAILMPNWLWESMSAAELRQVVLHEAAHLARYDDWTNLIQKLALAFFPLNPVLLWIERRLCLEREMACDDAVLSAAISPRTYAACLTGLAEKGLRRQSTSLAPGAWTRQSELVRRVHGILSHNRNASPMVARSVAAACIVAMLGVAVAFSRVPELVSFAPAAPAAGAANAVNPAGRSVAADAVSSVPAPDKYRRAAVHRIVRKAAPRRVSLLPAASSQAPLEVANSTPPVPATTQLRRPEFRQVGILQSTATGQSWIVLSVWRPAPVNPTDPVSLVGRNPPTRSQPITRIQTGWILIQI